MSQPDVQIDVNDLLNAQSNASAQQIAALLRRVAELEAINAALRRQLADRITEDTRLKAVGDG
jgi:hypothetical protein